MDKTEVIKRRYNRTAKFYDRMDWMLSDSTRRQVFSNANGKITLK